MIIKILNTENIQESYKNTQIIKIYESSELSDICPRKLKKLAYDILYLLAVMSEN